MPRNTKHLPPLAPQEELSLADRLTRPRVIALIVVLTVVEISILNWLVPV